MANDYLYLQLNANSLKKRISILFILFCHKTKQGSTRWKVNNYQIPKASSSLSFSQMLTIEPLVMLFTITAKSQSKGKWEKIILKLAPGTDNAQPMVAHIYKIKLKKLSMSLIQVLSYYPLKRLHDFNRCFEVKAVIPGSST